MVSFRTLIKTRLHFGFFLFYETLIGLKKFASLLPNNWLAETPQELALMRLADNLRKGSGFLK
ncbi:hypothetical protein [Peribacillus sp. FSL E2-0159]|uniref:hypothetical protein n=1 Tax=Peribacillus sp. FSL E2-0159 TaxID=2975289 RepID=UPI00315ACFF8